MSARILLVDDDPQSLDSTRKILELARHEVVVARDGQEALEKVRPSIDGELPVAFDVIVTDVRMPRMGGIEFLRAFALCGAETPVILMTAFGRVEDAVWAMKLGAVDFLSKPFKRQVLLEALENALERSRKRAALQRVAPASQGSVDAAQLSTDGIIGESFAIESLRQTIAQVAPTLATVLITGESGVGKERVARAIHEQSTRRNQPWIAINCAALPENLMEAELFGFEKGSFTGAGQAKVGLFESANGGTLLLDEIGDMPLSLQAKLLRVLQEGEVRRVGSNSSRKIDVRIIAATHRNLKDCVRQGTFREDLLFRIEVIGLHIPSLRERLEDVPLLCANFLRQASERHSKNVESITTEAIQVLCMHEWPGNIRELSNVIERAVVFCGGSEVAVEHLPAHLLLQSKNLAAGRPLSKTGAMDEGKTISVPFGTPLREVEDLLIRKTLEATDGDKSMTAKLLGINSRTIYRKLEEQKKS